MAVATQTQVQFPGRSWDEEIVPALRKRLKEESAALAKRMSGQSFHSSEEAQNLNMSAAASTIASYANNSLNGSSSKQRAAVNEDSGYFDSAYPAPSNHSHSRAASSSGRPSGIPRPSFSTSPAEVARAGNNNDSTPNTPRPSKNNRSRSRTISTPQPFDNEGYSGVEDEGATPIQRRAQFQGARSSSRSGSPMPGPSNGHLYPSRIPRPNTQQSHHSPSSLTPGSNFMPSLEKGFAWPSSYNATNSTPDLLREPKGPHSEMATPRESMDEEGEYEHWYRGDVSRSGGVGEFKVAKRREMLDIANYGHLNPGPRSVASSRPGSIIDPIFPNRVPRKRAGSLTERGSVYIEDESVTEWVIDEMPLTDDDSAIFPDPSDPYGGIGIARTSARSPTPAGRKAIQIPPMPTLPDSMNNSHPPHVVRSFTSPIPLAHSQPSQLPYAQQQQTRPLVNGVRGNQAQIQAQNQSQNQKRARVNSKPTQNKKPKAQTVTGASRGKGGLNVNAENERPVSSLLVDAIPSWSVPVAKDGNWDNVVIPVVARKMGLEGHLEEVDGSTPKKKPPGEVVPSPAPGTFGYDYSKYRPPRPDNMEMTPLGEFGSSDPNEPQTPPPRWRHQSPEPSGNEAPQHPPPSPTPFSYYNHTRPPADNTRDTHHMIRLHTGRNQTPPILLHPPTMNSMTEEKRKKLEDDEDAGCCKCVVM